MRRSRAERDKFLRALRTGRLPVDADPQEWRQKLATARRANLVLNLCCIPGLIIVAVTAAVAFGYLHKPFYGAFFTLFAVGGLWLVAWSMPLMRRRQDRLIRRADERAAGTD